MRRLIRQLADWARLFLAPTGRRRAEWSAPPSRQPQASRPTTLRPEPSSPAPAPTVLAWYAPLDGTDTALVRPYLTAHECEEKARLQRLRRDILWCATYGVDLDSRDIHAGLGAAS